MPENTTAARYGYRFPLTFDISVEAPRLAESMRIRNQLHEGMEVFGAGHLFEKFADPSAVPLRDFILTVSTPLPADKLAEVRAIIQESIDESPSLTHIRTRVGEPTEFTPEGSNDASADRDNADN